MNIQKLLDMGFPIFNFWFVDRNDDGVIRQLNHFRIQTST
jgi:hypothetical protein